MKCALELITIKEIAKMEYEAEQRELDRIAKEKFENLSENTVRWCDTVLNDIFVKKAEAREPLEAVFKMSLTKDRLGNYIFTVIEKDGLIYANGKCSYSAIGQQISEKILKTYLENLCFKVEFKEDWYKKYGWGDQKCVKVRVYVPKE